MGDGHLLLPIVVHVTRLNLAVWSGINSTAAAGWISCPETRSNTVVDSSVTDVAASRTDIAIYGGADSSGCSRRNVAVTSAPATRLVQPRSDQFETGRSATSLRRHDYPATGHEYDDSHSNSSIHPSYQVAGSSDASDTDVEGEQALSLSESFLLCKHAPSRCFQIRQYSNHCILDIDLKSTSRSSFLYLYIRIDNYYTTYSCNR